MRRRPPRGGRGLKRRMEAVFRCMSPSPPTRGAWIETLEGGFVMGAAAVAPHAGGVD